MERSAFKEGKEIRAGTMENPRQTLEETKRKATARISALGEFLHLKDKCILEKAIYNTVMYVFAVGETVLIE